MIENNEEKPLQGSEESLNELKKADEAESRQFQIQLIKQIAWIILMILAIVVLAYTVGYRTGFETELASCNEMLRDMGPLNYSNVFSFS